MRSKAIFASVALAGITLFAVAGCSSADVADADGANAAGDEGDGDGMASAEEPASSQAEPLKAQCRYCNYTPGAPYSGSRDNYCGHCHYSFLTSQNPNAAVAFHRKFLSGYTSGGHHYHNYHDWTELASGVFRSKYILKRCD